MKKYHLMSTAAGWEEGVPGEHFCRCLFFSFFFHFSFSLTSSESAEKSRLISMQ